MRESDDVRSMYDSTWIGAWDLDREYTLTIKEVERGELMSQRGKSKKPVIHFNETEKKLPIGKTVMKVIAGMYGFKTREWVGKRIALYATTTSVGGEMVDCVRVRPKVPPANAKTERLKGKPVDQEMRAKQDAAFGRNGNGGVVPDPYPSDEEQAAAIDAGRDQ